MGKLEEILAKLDNTTEPISEIRIYNEIVSGHENDNEQETLEYEAESLAFSLIEDFSDGDSGWGTYYGPKFVGTLDDGTMIRIPELEQITPNIIYYWKKRAQNAKNPVMRARYADLVWDLSLKVASIRPDFRMAQITIESIVEIAKKNGHLYKSYMFRKLERALFLAIKLNNKALIEKVRDAIIEYEDLVGEDDDLGLWGHSYDLLYKNKKVGLTTEQTIKIVSDLENRLKRIISSSSAPNPWAVERAAVRLADYYNGIGQHEDVKRVLLELETVFENVSQEAAPLLGIDLHEQLHSTYAKYSLKDEADRIIIKIRKLGQSINEKMQKVSHKISISQEEMNDHVQSMIDGDLDLVLTNIAINYIPGIDRIKELLEDQRKEAPLISLIPKQLTDQGRIIATIGPLDEDLEGNIVYEMAQTLGFSGIFLNHVLNATISKFNLKSQHLIDYLYQSPVFDERKRDAITKGIELYLSGEYFLAIHILIPQIENIIRRTLEMRGGPVLKLQPGGYYKFRLLDEILRDPIIEEVLGEDTAVYLRTLLTDRRGWNIRNKVCHGLATAENLNKWVADRLIHVLLLLALLNPE